jgi:RNA-directed DNA polymerase
MKGETKPKQSLETKLNMIANRSREKLNAKFQFLMPLFTAKNLSCCFDMLDGKKAVGIDGVTKQKYGENLQENILLLVESMKKMGYKPQPVREVLIPKPNGKKRPLGISGIEDKIVQSMFSKVLEAIYDPIFRKTSFGFIANKNCHMALKEVLNSAFNDRIRVVIDVDLENFFGNIDHKKLIALLKLKIQDERFIRYINRMLKAGIMKEGTREETISGTPQGSLASPILANIFGHYAFDTWFEDEVIPRCKGNVKLVRYCDDMVILCEKDAEAEAILKALKGRAQRFGLKFNADKTKVVSFSRQNASRGIKQEAFDFLGFTFYIGKSRNGRWIPKLKTCGKSFRSKLRNVDTWCRKYRDTASIRTLWEKFCIKLRGHINYYGVSHNQLKVVDFIHKARRSFFKWINRRSQRRSMSWEKFLLFEKQFPPPKILIRHSLF